MRSTTLQAHAERETGRAIALGSSVQDWRRIEGNLAAALALRDANDLAMLVLLADGDILYRSAGWPDRITCIAGMATHPGTPAATTGMVPSLISPLTRKNLPSVAAGTVSPREIGPPPGGRRRDRKSARVSMRGAPPTAVTTRRPGIANPSSLPGLIPGTDEASSIPLPAPRRTPAATPTTAPETQPVVEPPTPIARHDHADPGRRQRLWRIALGTTRVLNRNGPQLNAPLNDGYAAFTPTPLLACRSSSRRPRRLGAFRPGTPAGAETTDATRRVTAEGARPASDRRPARPQFAELIELYNGMLRTSWQELPAVHRSRRMPATNSRRRSPSHGASWNARSTTSDRARRYRQN